MGRQLALARYVCPQGPELHVRAGPGPGGYQEDVGRALSVDVGSPGGPMSWEAGFSEDLDIRKKAEARAALLAAGLRDAMIWCQASYIF